MIDLDKFRTRSEAILAARNDFRRTYAHPIPEQASPKSNSEAWRKNPALVIARQVRERLYQATIPDNIPTSVLQARKVG